MDSAVEIKSYAVRDIKALLNDQTFWELDPLPVNKQRLVSMIRNPRAAEDDLVLVVAYANGKVICYGGVFPDRVFVNGIPKKVGCLTTNWADPAWRRKGIAGAIRDNILNAYDGRVYVSEFSESAKRSIDRMNLFTPLKPMKMNQLRLRIFILEKYRKRFALMQKIDPLFTWFEMLINLPVRARALLWKVAHKPDEGFRVEYLAEIDDKTARFIEMHQENNISRRGAAELDWITRYPWVLQAPTPDITTPRFFFSTVAKTFSYVKYRILDREGEIRAFVLLRLRDGTLHIPYAYHDDADMQVVAHILCLQLIEFGAAKFETCNEALVDQIKQLKFPTVGTHVRDRHTRLSNELAKGADLDAITLQDGDGDKVFT